MKYHTTKDGNVQPCTASIQRCPLDADEHFPDKASANYALTMRALESHADMGLTIPDNFSGLVPTRRARAPRESNTSLSVNDLEAFRTSAANRPQQVREDWREKLAADAETNGDLDADRNPNTSFVNAYWDATPDEDED